MPEVDVRIGVQLATAESFQAKPQAHALTSARSAAERSAKTKNLAIECIADTKLLHRRRATWISPLQGWLPRQTLVSQRRHRLSSRAVGDRTRPSQRVDIVVFGAVDNGFGNGDLSAELASAKAAMLFADHVWVQTYRSVFLLARMTGQVRSAKTRLGGHLSGMSADEQALLVTSINDELQRRARSGAEDAARAAASFQELVNLGLTPEGVLDLPELVAELVSKDDSPHGDPASYFHGLAEMDVERWVAFKPDERSPSAMSTIKELNLLHHRGLLSIDPGDPTPMWTSSADQIESVMFAMIERMIDTIDRDSSIVNPVIAGTEFDPSEFETKLRRLDDATVAGPQGTAVATRLLLSLPNFSSMPVDELVDLRDRVSPSLARFRSAMAEFQETLDAEKTPTTQFEAQVEDLRLRIIEPELEDMREALRDNGAIPTVARGIPLTASGVIGLGVSAAISGPLLAGATAVAAGVSTAVAKEVIRRRSSGSDLRKHRLYLLWQADQASRRFNAS